MTQEELQKKYEDLQASFVKIETDLKEEQESKKTLQDSFDAYKEETSVQIEDYKKRNDTLVEHNNNLFRQVTQPPKTEPQVKEKDADELLSEVLNKF